MFLIRPCWWRRQDGIRTAATCWKRLPSRNPHETSDRHEVMREPISRGSARRRLYERSRFERPIHTSSPGSTATDTAPEKRGILIPVSNLPQHARSCSALLVGIPDRPMQDPPRRISSGSAQPTARCRQIRYPDAASVEKWWSEEVVAWRSTIRIAISESNLDPALLAG